MLDLQVRLLDTFVQALRGLTRKTRVRRIKCGEELPKCANCTKTGRQCDGNTSVSVKRAFSTDYLLPSSRSNTRSRLEPRNRLLAPRYPVLVEPSTTLFGNAREKYYFETFCSRTTLEIFDGFAGGGLRLIFLQACESEPAIRHSAIALGALDKTSEAALAHDQMRTTTNQTTNEHYQNALFQYSKAIQQARDTKPDFRTALMTCLIIIAFEAWKGSHQLAVEQIQVGLSLVSEWKRTSSPTSPTIEKDLTLAFSRLSIQLISPVAHPMPITSAGLASILATMPTSFINLTQSYGYSQAIFGTFIRFAEKGQASDPAWTTPTLYPINFFCGYDAPIVDPALEEERQTLMRNIHRWLAALRPLVGTDVEEKQRNIALLSAMRCQGLYIAAATAGTDDEADYDVHTPMYRSMITSASLILNSSTAKQRQGPKFSLDTSLVMPLWHIGSKCRDPDVRKPTVELLLNMNIREGIWDSRVAGTILRCIVELEEEFMEEGWVPEWARTRRVELEVDLERRAATIRCWQKTSEGCEVAVVRRRAVSW